jgi:hypothetical protein
VLLLLCTRSKSSCFANLALPAYLEWLSLSKLSYVICTPRVAKDQLPIVHPQSTTHKPLWTLDDVEKDFGNNLNLLSVGKRETKKQEIICLLLPERIRRIE